MTIHRTLFDQDPVVVESLGLASIDAVERVVRATLTELCKEDGREAVWERYCARTGDRSKVDTLNNLLSPAKAKERRIGLTQALAIADAAAGRDGVRRLIHNIANVMGLRVIDERESRLLELKETEIARKKMDKRIKKLAAETEE